VGGLVAAAVPVRAATPAAWGFDLDWSLIQTQADLDQVIGLWQPLRGRVVSFGSGNLDYLWKFLRSTGATVLLTGPDQVRLVQAVLGFGKIPYVLAQDRAQAEQLARYLPFSQIGLVTATPPYALAYATRSLSMTAGERLAQQREIALNLQPLVQSACWFLGLELTNLPLHMYAVTWLLRQSPVGLVLAGNFLALDGWVDLQFQPTPKYEWWRREQAQTSKIF